MIVRKIKGLRSDLGLTQKEFANKLGMSLRSYRNKEKGEYPFNQIEMVKIMMIAGSTPQEAGELFFSEAANTNFYNCFDLYGFLEKINNMDKEK